MYPWRLIAILEAADPSFKDVFYPKSLRCRMDKRLVRAIDENWPVFFPAHKECRGPNWSITIPENEPLYKPQQKSQQKLKRWKQDIKGTLAEIRAYNADITWKRFEAICRKIPRLRPILRDFKPLAGWLMQEESMWPRCGAMMGHEDYFRGQMRAMLAPDSPYRHSDPSRLQFLDSDKNTSEKLRLIMLMRSLFDRPLMILAMLQACASRSKHSQFWLPIKNHIDAIIETPAPLTFRKKWLEHAMQVSGATKKDGKSCPRKWARMLLSGKPPDLDIINAKAIEVNSWLKGKKRPSVKTIIQAGRIIFTKGNSNDIGNDLWLFSWMIAMWLEKHFTEIAAEFKNDSHKIKNYYHRFFHYLEITKFAGNGKGAGGLFTRQP